MSSSGGDSDDSDYVDCISIEDQDPVESMSSSGHSTDSDVRSTLETVDSTRTSATPTSIHSSYFIQHTAFHHGSHCIPRHMTQQQLFPHSPSRQHALASSLIPNHFQRIAAQYDYRAYSGQYSVDGTLFYSSTQDFKVHVYKVASDGSLVPWQECAMQMGGWTITDCTLSTNNEFIAFSSITPVVYLSRIKQNVQDTESSVPLMLSRSNFGIWSLRFSGDGHQLVAGTSDYSILVYDIETKTLLHEIDGHDDDVNSVCFAHPLESHVLFTGSDDALIKVWQVDRYTIYDRDQRSLGRHAKPSGILQGHTQGITYITSKGDGRYCLSNGKDQAMKLWDIRKMTSTVQDNLDIRLDFDYRMQAYPLKKPQPHPHDTSVLTMTGHSVLKTLIRCHFSPLYMNGQRYAYTGSAEGHVHIYDLEQQGKRVAKLSVKDAMKHVHHDASPPRRRPYFSFFNTGTVTRDCSWHPFLPMMASSTNDVDS